MIVCTVLQVISGLHGSLNHYMKISPLVNQIDKKVLISDSFSSLKIFEIYRVQSNDDALTQRLLYQFDEQTQKLRCLDTNFIWHRRKNLTGVHLIVSIIENNPFIVVKNNVSELFKKFTYFYAINNAKNMLKCYRCIQFSCSFDIVYSQIMERT